ncbi:MBL fold metallo-hydrolase [Parablautia muri]|uniref:MBL fold metallo-hydrolase n=1 Tax=Parablautia muri TaxID=2320879 RepID=A0A9X5GR63_9FIRM|nr:MBL fold metallo-hydrolase [Parablautia muri]NBJ92004.1 MBL fold metallo-hydrolase [Parablautia muri]
MDIIKMSKNTWRIEDEGVRFFLLSGDEKALLIDSGMKIHNAKEIVRQLVSLPIELLNTHGDIDHVASNGEFEKFYMSPAEASNYYRTQKKSGCFIPVENGDILDLGNRKLEIVHIPGHTPGSIAVLDLDNRILYSGDTVQDDVIFMFGVQREFHAYMHSLEKLEKYVGKFDEIYPSHGSLPVGPELISKLYKGAGSILEGTVPGEDVKFHGMDLKQYDLGCAKFLCDF